MSEARGAGIERIAELNFHFVRAGVQTNGQPGRFAGGSHAIESAVRLAVPGPRIQAAGVEVAVAGMKTATHRAGREVRNRELHHAALELAAVANDTTRLGLDPALVVDALLAHLANL